MKKIITSLLLLSSIAFAQNAPCKDKFFTLSISAKNEVRVIDLVDNLAGECQISVVFEDGGVQKQLEKNVGYIHANDYSLKELFELIFDENNIYYEYEEQKQILRLAYIKTKTFFIDYVNFKSRTSTSTKSINIGLSGGADSGDGDNNNDDGEGTTGGSRGSNTDQTTIETSNDFGFWNNIKTEVQSILSQDSFESAIGTKTLLNRDAGTMTVSATKKQLDRVEAYIDTIMQRLHKQIMIEAKIVEVTTTDSSSNGIDWSQLFAMEGTLNGTFTDAANTPSSSSITYNYSMSISKILEFLDSYGDVDVVSNPKILTLNNQPAVINVGEQLNYRYESGDLTIANDGTTVLQDYETNSLFVGVSLSVTPEVTRDGHVMLTVQPVVSSLRDSSADSEANEDRVLPPDTKIKQMSSIVKVKEGNKVIIGGLIEKENSTVHDGVPILKDLPIFSLAFSKKTQSVSKKELVVILTPRFVDGSTTPSLETFEQQYTKELR